MKKILFMAVAAFMFTFSVNAQNQKRSDSTKKVMHQYNRQMPYAKVDLTQSQKDQMQKIREDGKTRRQAIQNNSSLTDSQKTEKMKELNKSQREQMNSVLTKEQKEKMKDAREKGKKDWKRSKGNKMHQKKGDASGKQA